MAIFKRRVGGKWDGNYWIGYPLGNGQYRREKIGPSHALAQEIWRKRLTQIAEQREFPVRASNARPFSSLLEKFWELHGRHLRSTSWGWMLPRIRERFAQKRLGSISGSDIQAFYNEIAGATTHANANRYLSLIRSVFNKGRRWGDFCGENPCAAVEKGREAHHRLRYLSRAEIEALLSKTHPRLYPVLVTALLTGMRRGEVLGLRWENINLERDTIYVLQSKSGKPRELPIPAKLRAVLTTLGTKATGPVFDLPVIMLRRYLAHALSAARIPTSGPEKVTFHTTRHTFGSWFMMRGGSIYTLQNLMGHSSIAMTMRYAHLSRGHLASEIAAFESAIPTKTTVPPTAIPEGHTQPLPQA